MGFRMARDRRSYVADDLLGESLRNCRHQGRASSSFKVGTWWTFRIDGCSKVFVFNHLHLCICLICVRSLNLVRWIWDGDYFFGSLLWMVVEECERWMDIVLFRWIFTFIEIVFVWDGMHNVMSGVFIF